jgi:hypothetical protein
MKSLVIVYFQATLINSIFNIVFEKLLYIHFVYFIPETSQNAGQSGIRISGKRKI